MPNKPLKIKVPQNIAGMLYDTLSGKDISQITHLEIEGKINADDFTTMRDEMPSLSHINLEECDIEAIDGYGADMIPNMAFCYYTGYDQYGYKTYEAKHWLKEVILPKSAKIIGTRAFCYSQKLRKVELPKNLLCICEYAFYACSKLKGKLEIPKLLETIEEKAFMYCRSMDCDLILPSGLTNIGTSAFQDCAKIPSIKLPKSNCEIGDNAFCACFNICADIIIPDECEKINQLSFYDCQHITSVEIPATCIEIADNAFGDTYNLEKVILHSTTPPKLGKDAFTNQKVQTKLFVPEGCSATYSNSEWGERFKLIYE